MSRSFHAKSAPGRYAPAVVLHLGPSALEVSRALGRRGVSVYGLDTRLDIGAYSRYLRPLLCADPRRAAEALCDSLIGLARELTRRPVLMPLGDDWALYVSDHRSRLSPHYSFVQSPAALLASLTDKAETYDLARRHGLDVARHVVVADVSDLERAGAEVGYPCFLKPARSPDWAQPEARAVLGQTKLLCARTPSSLRAAFERARPFAERHVVQELVPGPDTDNYYVVCYVDAKGGPRARFVHRKLLMRPPGRGVGCLIESVRDDGLAARGMDFLLALGHLGLGGLEFKRDPRDGRLKLLDLNPRWGIGDSLAAACGIDMAWLYYLDCLGMDLDVASDYRAGVKWVQMRSYLRAAWMARRQGQVGIVRSILNLRGELHHSVFALDDLRPTAWALGDMLAGRLSRGPQSVAAAGRAIPRSRRDANGRTSGGGDGR